MRGLGIDHLGPGWAGRQGALPAGDEPTHKHPETEQSHEYRVFARRRRACRGIAEARLMLRSTQRYLQQGDGDADAKLLVLVGVEGDDVKRLERTSEARGKAPAGAVAELLREADRSTA